MKKIIMLCLISTAIFASHFADKLPLESKQLINSFECFSEDDKTMIYSYLLALKYRMENVENREALVNSDLEYWRLWHIVSDLESICGLNYKFDDILEEIITPTQKDKKTLKRLRRVESSIRTDGSSESSAKMNKYDEKLRIKILLNPPKYQLLAKNVLLNNYDLSPLKNYTSNSIPKNVFDQIEEQNLSGIKKNVLLRYAVLTEGLIRNYDQPKTRHALKQESIYLDQCIKYYNLKFRHDFYHNSTRKLARRSIAHDSILRLKTEFLPKEVSSYCENNISTIQVTTFKPKVDDVMKRKKVQISVKLENLKEYLKKYDGDKKKKKYAEQYFSLMKSELEKNSTPTPSLESLKLLRLQQCLVGNDDKEDFSLIMARVKDFRLEGIKERFYANIFNSQRWWKTTIHLKMKSEGESKELKNFFNCSELNSKFSMNSLKKSPMQKNSTKKYKDKMKEIKRQNEIKRKVSAAGWQKRELLKYFSGEYANRSASEINNKKSIEAGIIPKKFISDDGEIIPAIGTKITLKGMPKGGVRISYDGLKLGQECEGMTEFLNMDETIYFQNKSYRGIDYIMINDTKIMIDNFSAKYAKELCSKKETNKISYVKENMVQESKYNDIKEYSSLYNQTYRESSRKGGVRKPYSISLHQGSRHYLLIHDKAKIVNVGKIRYEDILPSEYDNKFKAIMSKDGSMVASNNFKGMSVYDVKRKKSHVFTNIKGSPVSFGMNNTVLALLSKRKVHFLDISTGVTLGSIQPKFVEPEREYFTPRIKSISISEDSKHLYILSDKGKIEHWHLSKSRKEISIEYIETLKINDKLALSLQLNTNNDEELMISTNTNSVDILSRVTGKVIKSYPADRQMRADHVTISHDSRYILAHDFRYVYIWDAKTTKLIDVIGSNKNEVYGAVFLPDESNKIRIIGKQEEIWKIN
ncbi:MAG: WD40 repeat domain-containing protein [Campylobacterota bacterium]